MQARRRYDRIVAKRSDELGEPLVVEIDDDYSALDPAERARLTDEWLDALRTDRPTTLTVSGAEMVEQARRDAGW